VIPVKSSGSTVKCPKIFSLPILPQVDLPYDIFVKGWDEALVTLKLCAIEWKFFLGASWPVRLWSGETGASNTEPRLPSLNIPSPWMGMGGYDP
jgi:hypothetical protein